MSFFDLIDRCGTPALDHAAISIMWQTAMTNRRVDGLTPIFSAKTRGVENVESTSESASMVDDVERKKRSYGGHKKL
jgi:hypothetical protein